MVRVIGIDPGTKSFDFCGLEDGKVILDTSVSTLDINKDPEVLSDIILDTEADLVVGPSGFGVPLTGIEDIGERELFLMSLIKKGDNKSILGMRRSINIMKEKGLPVMFIPGVIHLPTVPGYRKINKIDMGTADKLCCAALGIWDQALRFDEDYGETSFIMLEMGFGYTAAIAVNNGQIMDGVGGSSGNIGFLSMGGMDAELAYLIGSFGKEFIFRGGIGTIVGTPDKLMENEDALNAYMEGAVKDILSLTASVKPREILVSGRISRIGRLFGEFKKSIDFAPVRRLEGFRVKKVKEAAQGAALIADGLYGGEYKELVDIMKIREAKGTSLDYILLPEIEQVKKEHHV
ncbi:MAG TPA: DUF1464 family protein [Candidatus Methanoperedens sp.]